MSKRPKAASPWIVPTNRERFEQDVFERSRDTLVVIDFWAEWCAPCRMLTPVLEKLASEYGGKFTLVKANTDELPGVAARFGVQGIPAVMAVRESEVLDFFVGALPEPQIRSWLDRVLLQGALAEAKRLQDASPSDAEAKYRDILIDAPKNAEAKVGLARALLAQEKIDECRAVVHELEQRGFLEPEAQRVKAALDLRDKEGDDVAQRRAAVEADPDDFELQFQLAESLAGSREYEEALETCLALIERDKTGVGERARQLMIDIFRVLPDDSPLTSTYRRRLSMILY
jgi:putative thioredoxin